MDKMLLEKSLELEASASKVWRVITEPSLNKQWLNEFSVGAWVETDWNVGSEVIWWDGLGNVGAKGKVAVSDKDSLLVIEFPEEDNPGDGPEGSWDDYSEKYQLTRTDDGTTLSITAGPIPREYYQMHLQLWEKAIAKMKELSESRG